jgi:hypothetical protein
MASSFSYVTAPKFGHVSRSIGLERLPGPAALGLSGLRLRREPIEVRKATLASILRKKILRL